jgi:hypothetical protein
MPFLTITGIGTTRTTSEHDFPRDGKEPHTHAHVHEPLTHRHPHCPDIHHRHRHS